MAKQANVILTHPTGNQFVRSLANKMAENNILHEFNTTVAVFPNEILYKLGGLSSFRDLRRRSYDSSLKKFTNRYSFYETGRLLANKLGLKSVVQSERGLFCVDQVYQQLDKTVASSLTSKKKKGVTGVYAYEDGALSIFEEAQKEGAHCFYDQPIGYWRAKRKLLHKAKEKRPEWVETMRSFRDSDSKLSRKDQEISMAQNIFVASSFTAKTLQEYPGEIPPVHIIPYGFPKVVQERNYSSLKNRKLKALFVGGLSQRKGVAELFEAVDSLKKHVDLTVVGRKPTQNCAALNQNLANHRWIPSIPHEEVLELMRSHDILLFPSLFEGFGMVITEAMSQGTPVITTDRTAGPDLIKHSENGWLVEAGSVNSLKTQIEEILSKPSQLKKAGSEAIETARKRPWSIYGQEVVDTIKRITEEY